MQEPVYVVVSCSPHQISFRVGTVIAPSSYEKNLVSFGLRNMNRNRTFRRANVCEGDRNSASLSGVEDAKAKLGIQ